ncbi:MAG: inverse autotransporter beta domain-containing protein [Candidatus Omnitrophica bacterium]|nr:inverse autotransporter beta domain-containing protein [Candidatus Omnitrophota bacterium]
MCKYLLKVSCIIIFSCNFLYASFCDDSESSIPDWLKRVELSGQWETDTHPTFYFQTVQPLYETSDSNEMYFIQPRVSISSNDFTYNLGAGYRKIVNENLLLGVNVFGDYQDLKEHGRLGIGFEALGQVLETRLNGYLGLTTKRVVEESSTSTTYERVADGLDLEIGAPVPYVNWLKVFGSGFWYDFDKFSDKTGWKIRLEAKPIEACTLEFYTWDDNKGDQEYGGRLRFGFAFDTITDFKQAFNMSEEPYLDKDLKELLLIPVERNFNIVVEKWSETGTMSVEVGRGT